MRMENSDSLRDQAIERFWETIPPLWGMVRRQIRSTAAARFGLTFEQFYILRHIRKGSTSVSELAAVKRISRPAISQAVDILVNKELLTRVQSSKDRRYVTLALTPAGNSLLDAVFKDTNAWMKERMQHLTGEDLAEVIDAFEILNAIVEKPAGCLR
jgi:DNA-binding MarR family transcriptional regulator